MEVQRAVSKVGQVRCLFGQNDGLGMTAKTQFVVFLAEGCVKLGRIFFHQQAKMLAPVTDVAAAAVILGDGTVQELLVFNFIRKSRQRLFVAYLDGFIVAGRAQTRRVLLQEELNARRVRGMALQAPVDFIYHAVLIG